jgi:hypothetical protein
MEVWLFGVSTLGAIFWQCLGMLMFLMKIAPLGATGFCRFSAAKEALARGHTVTAIVRHP